MAVAAPRERDTVRLLEADPELAGGMDTRMLAAVSAPLVRLGPDPGLCVPEPPPGAMGLLVLEGLLSRQVMLSGRSSVELLGPGDLLRPWQDDGESASVPSVARWRVLEPARLAVLDADVVEALRLVPGALDVLLERAERRAHALSARLAIAQMPRLEDRLVAVFWCLADRWGRVEPGGVTIPLRLSHRVLAGLVCAQRPSVSVALKHLADDGLLERAEHGTWRLRPAAREALDS
jgi:CRP/FNR family transcriptional regulator, cyclic AMP receptor protein